MKTSIFACGLGLLLLASASGTAASQPVAPDRIPAIAFLQSPELSIPRLSPSGRFLGFIGRLDGKQCVCLLDRTTGKVRQLFRPGEGKVIQFWWKGDQHLLFAVAGEWGGCAYFFLGLDSTRPEKIYNLQHVFPSCINPLPDDPDRVICFPGGYGTRVTEVNLRTGSEHTVENLPGTENDCVTSYAGELRAYTHRWAGEWKIAWRSSAKTPWHEQKGKGDIPPFCPAAMDTDDRHLLVFAYDQGDTVALMRLDPDTDERVLLVQHPDRDVSEVSADHAFNHTPPFATVRRFGADDLVVLDESARPFYASLAQTFPGMYNRWVSSSADRSLRIIWSWNGSDPGRCYLYDARSKAVSLLWPCDSSLPATAMGEVRCFTYQTRDGINESGYVVLPHQASTGSPPPLVVLPMRYVGEPADCGRDFDGPLQFLASRGFAVARFAVRGSYGFGRNFEKAANFAVDGKVVRDAEDGVKYLTRTGLVDEKRTALLGDHAGGLIALRTAAASPLFRAVAVVDCWDSVSVENIAWLTSSLADTNTIIGQLGGIEATYKAVRQLDPNTFLQSLSAPVLLAYTSEYASTANNAIQLRHCFAKFKKPYEWYQIDGRDETRTHAEYQAELYTKIVDFLKRTL